MLGLILLASAWLEQHLRWNVYFELVVLIIITLICFILLGGIEHEAYWAWPLAAILFSLLLGNTTLVWWQLHAIGATSIAGIFSILGMMVAFVSLPEKNTPSIPVVEPYTSDSVEPTTLQDLPALKRRRGRPPKGLTAEQP